MPVCPTCHERFADEALQTCPSDGTPLVAAPSTEPGRRVSTPREAPTNVGRPVGPRLASPAPRGVVVAATAAAPSAEIEVGDVIGEYHVTGRIGEGGMGSVYAGIHPVIGKKVAIKVLNAALSHDREIVDRFAQEARAVNQIAHRNIVDIFAFGQLPSGRHYCVMEYLEGCSLRARLSRPPPLTHPEVFALLGDVLDALAAAHAEGIVHRDLKPDNIFLVEEKSGAFRAKLLDFGVAKLLRRPSDLGRTRTGAPLGTPFYMSPEQCRNRAVDVRTDIYAMGVIMFEIFTGHVPFAGSDYIDTVNGHLSEPPQQPSSFVTIAPRLEALILRCLEKDPEMRPQSAAELAREVAAVAAEAAGEPVPVPPPIHPDSAERSTVPPSGRPTVPPPEASSTSSARPPAVVARPRPLPRALAVLGLAVIAGGAAFVAARARHRQPPPSTPATVQLSLTSEPADAQVTVQGQPAGRTPVTLTWPYAESIAVRVEKAGFAAAEEILHPAPGTSSLRRGFTLAPSPGDLFISTSVPHARWTVDGTPRGEGASLRLDHVEPGSHLVRVEADRYLPLERTVQIQPGQLESFDWPLTPAPKKREGHRQSTLPDAPKSDFRP